MSDDNSSIQSSPWQRDHSWKQSSPRRNQSKEMVFYFWRPKHKRSNCKLLKSRRPYDVRVERTSKDLTSSIKKSVRASLLVIVQNLLDKSTTTTTRADMVVSPRKRFLREMEKDKVQVEDGCQKRSRNKTPQTQTKIGSPINSNGTTTDDIKPTRNCSYSITSLLAEDRNAKRSPSNSPSHFMTQPQYCSPSSEDRWYSESVDRLRSIELSVSRYLLF